ncbi:conserved hypothetical protein [Ricinus communis]|uniref:Uncharacterized protein n=1 Tax=Ricinus communis TaxID=3988 RepID=B9S0U9_RICCO|nr:conserved hypothetical protein [Ricinus communis]
MADQRACIPEEYDTPLLAQPATHQAFQQHAEPFTARHGLAVRQVTNTKVEQPRAGFSCDELAKKGEVPAMTYEDFIGMLTISRVRMVCTLSTTDPRVGTILDSFDRKRGWTVGSSSSTSVPMLEQPMSLLQLTTPEGVVFGDLLHSILVVVMMPSKSGYVSRYGRLDKSFIPKVLELPRIRESGLRGATSYDHRDYTISSIGCGTVENLPCFLA